MNVINKKNLNQSFLKTFDDNLIKSTVRNIIGLGIDEVLDIEQIKKIPIIKYLADGYDFVHSISNKLYLRKLAAFFYNFEVLSDEDKLNGTAKFDEDENLGENLLFLIDQAQNLDKAAIIGKLFSAYVHDVITRDDFDNSIFALEHIMKRDQDVLLDYQFHQDNIEYKAAISRLAQCGLLEEEYDYYEKEFIKSKNKNVKYHITELGAKLIVVIFGKEKARGCLITDKRMSFPYLVN